MPSLGSLQAPGGHGRQRFPRVDPPETTKSSCTATSSVGRFRSSANSRRYDSNSLLTADKKSFLLVLVVILDSISATRLRRYRVLPFAASSRVSRSEGLHVTRARFHGFLAHFLTRARFAVQQNAVSVSLADLLPDASWDPSSDVLLDRFLEYAAGKRLTLYPAQEEAILELLDGKNVILNTPTGSGKSLVASALLFAALARGQRAVYTCPIKALVNEKWMALCREFGPEQVGPLDRRRHASTATRRSSAAPPRSSPTSRCARAPTPAFSDVVMDEFHYYADRDRGVAWQVPLLTLPQARFLLMSATLGDTRFFEEALTRLNGRADGHGEVRRSPGAARVRLLRDPAGAHASRSWWTKARRRSTSSTSRRRTRPSSAQDFTSLKICTQRAEGRDRRAHRRLRVQQPVRRRHPQVAPARHRPAPRRAAARSTACSSSSSRSTGLLKVICGTDTLGVGINVPIRTVLFTRLCKFDGQKTAHPERARVPPDRRARRAQGLRRPRLRRRAGAGARHREPPAEREGGARRQEGREAQAARAQLRQLGPEHLQAADRRAARAAGLALPGLARDAAERAEPARRRLPRDAAAASATATSRRPRSRRCAPRAWQLFRALVARGVVEFVAAGPRRAPRCASTSTCRTTSRWTRRCRCTCSRRCRCSIAESPDYALDVLTLVESILENPELILRKQLDRSRTARSREMKADGVEYEQRMEELEKLEYPKPLRDFIYETFNAFADRHPWVGEENIRPKSIAREMFENFRSFADYVHDYELQRVRGPAAAAPQQRLQGAQPDRARRCEERRGARDGAVPADAAAPGRLQPRGRVGADARSQLPAARAPARRGEDAAAARRRRAPDITRDAKAFTAAIRTRIFTFLRAWAIGDHAAALEALDAPPPVRDRRAAHGRRSGCDQHSRTTASTTNGVRLDPEARNIRHTHVSAVRRQPYVARAAGAGRPRAAQRLDGGV